MKKSAKAVLIAILLALGVTLVMTGMRTSPPPDAPRPNTFSEPQRDAKPTPRITTAPVTIDDAADEPDNPEAPGTQAYPPGAREQVMTPENMGRNRILIPAAGVYGRIVTGDVVRGELELPENRSKVTMWSGGAGLDATKGTTLMAGHVVHNGWRGVFFRLGRVQPGDVIYVSDAAGKRQRFAITAAEEVHRDRIPKMPIWTPQGDRKLVLVTCTGPTIQTGGGHWTYRDRLLVTARPA